MATRIVLRIEKPDGSGPYTSYHGVDKRFPSHMRFGTTKNGVWAWLKNLASPYDGGGLDESLVVSFYRVPKKAVKRDPRGCGRYGQGDILSKELLFDPAAAVLVARKSAHKVLTQGVFA